MNADRNSAAAGTVSPLPYLALCRVGGADAATFLQAQLAADVSALTPGDAAFAAYCSPRGQVLALLLAQRLDSGWLLAGGKQLLPQVTDRLRRFVLRSDVSFEALPERLAGLSGDASPDLDGVLSPRGTDLRYRVVAAGSEGGDPAGWRWRELLGGVLWLEPATSERYIPQMLGLDRLGAVSFRKGCYPGQEVVARAKYLGQVKRQPAWVECETADPPGAGAECSLYTGDRATDGTVVGVAARPDGRTLVVAVTALDPDAIVDGIDLGGGKIPARRSKEL